MIVRRLGMSLSVNQFKHGEGIAPPVVQLYPRGTQQDVGGHADCELGGFANSAVSKDAPGPPSIYPPALPHPVVSLSQPRKPMASVNGSPQCPARGGLFLVKCEM
eukprot:scaffold82500_cov29-Tisochrysis_lutea.AAC.1